MRRAVLLLAFVALPVIVGSALAIVTTAGDPHNLPIGKSVSTTTAKRGGVYACSMMSGGGGATATGAWIHSNGTYDLTLKPTVGGNVAWPAAKVTFTTSGGRELVKGNGLPKGTRTGIYPISPSSEAYKYDHNPNTISAQTVSWILPKPRAAARPGCLNGGPIGIAVNGAAIFDALDGENRDAVAYEILDRCQGHPERTGQYHYHSIPPCLTRGDKAGSHSSVVGFALDGYPITGSRGDQGKTLSNADLDVCHGHVGWIILNGQRVRTYHYHATLEFPYTLGCFHGTALKFASSQGAGGGNAPPGTGGLPPSSG